METNCFSFNAYNDYASCGIGEALKVCNLKNKQPVFICVGSDLVLGDSLGPLIGTKLKEKGLNAYVYGTLNQPVTAKEVEYFREYVKQLHPNAVIIAIDAAVGDENDVGLIKVVNRGLKPGLGVNKKLNVIGDVSIIGIVAGKSMKNYNLYNMTRLGLVYKMTERIVLGIEKFLKNENNNIRTNEAKEKAV